jgi:hypothetical protein
MTRLTLPAQAAAAVERIAVARGLTRAQAVTRAVGVLEVCEAAAAEGLWVGVAEREALLRVVVGAIER